MMNSDCERIRDQAADFVSGILSEAEIRELERHLGECPACSEYAKGLQEEDALLAGLFEKLDSGMRGREAEAIDAINDLEESAEGGMLSVGAGGIREFLSRYAMAAVVVFVVALYFIITLSWISQIKECIEPFENLLTQRACM
jgi:anti-sigma factor RsiW